MIIFVVLLNLTFFFCKVTVRCGCQTLKKEWLCQDVQAAYRSGGCDSEGVPKNQYGVGLLPCDFGCKCVKIPDAELHLRQAKPHGEKESHKANNTSKRKRRKQRVHEDENISKYQKMVVVIRWFLLLLVVSVIILASAYFGYKGLVRLSDWMNENEARQRRRRYSGM